MAKRIVLLWLALSPVWGCGYADIGDGTGTIGVYGTLRCSYPELTTQVFWELTDSTGPLSGASITLTDADSHERVEIPGATEAGQYALSWPGYHRKVQADIKRGHDGLRFRMEGPSPHVVTEPSPGTLVASHDRLHIQWRAPDGIRADRVDVHIDADDDSVRSNESAVGGSVVRDGGKARLSVDTIGKGPHGLKVARTMILSPKGAKRGAHVEHTYSVETAFYRR